MNQHLAPTKSEIEAIVKDETELKRRVQRIFEKSYGLDINIHTNGSTQKGTSLSPSLVPLDLDISVEASIEVLDKVSIPNDFFEGCQFLSPEFVENMRKEFGDIYYAGHRVSGKVNGFDFDMSLTDRKRDNWKWEYNYSPLSDFKGELLNQLLLLKLQLKREGTYGTEVGGVVGPAAELGIRHCRTYEQFRSRLSAFNPIKTKNIQEAFSPVDFPQDYFSLFGISDDPIHQGLVQSFRSTVPHTYNRLLKRDQSKDYVQIGTVHHTNARLLLFLLSQNHELTQSISDLGIEKTSTGYGLKVKPDERKEGKQLVELINLVPHQGIIPKNISITESLFKGKLGRDDYCVFIGHPECSINDGRVYMPFDLVARKDNEKSIELFTRYFK